MLTCDVTASTSREWWQAVSRACARLPIKGLDAEDYFQTALTAFYELTPEQRDDVRDVGGWLATVARRRAVDDIRRRCARERAEVRFGVRCPDRCPDIADTAVDTCSVDALLCGLPEPTRRALWALSTGMTAAEAAERLGTTRRAVEAHLYRARRHVQGAAAG